MKQEDFELLEAIFVTRNLGVLYEVIQISFLQLNNR